MADDAPEQIAGPYPYWIGATHRARCGQCRRLVTLLTFQPAGRCTCGVRDWCPV